MKNFSKLFLASLIAGSLIMTGCGGENPTGADVSGNDSSTGTDTSTDKDKNTETKGNVICGGIFSTSSSDQSLIGKDIIIELKDIISNKTIKGPQKFCDGQYGFNEIPNGFYIIKASCQGYNTTILSKYIQEDDQKFNISLQPQNPESEENILLNLRGKVLDQSLGYEVSAVSIEVKNDVSGNIIYTTSRFANGDYFINGISSGTYTVTFKKGGFREANTKLTIDDNSIVFYNIPVCKNGNFTNTCSYIDSAQNSRIGYQLPNLDVAVDLTESGAIAGVLTQLGPNKNFDLYRRIECDISSPLSFVTQGLTNDMSEFIISGLQPGYYTAVPAGTPAPINTGTSQAPEFRFDCKTYFEDQPVTLGKTLAIN